MDTQTQTQTLGEQLADEAINGLKEYYGVLSDPAYRARVKAHLVQEYRDTGNNQSDYERLRDLTEAYIDQNSSE